MEKTSIAVKKSTRDKLNNMPTISERLEKLLGEAKKDSETAVETKIMTAVKKNNYTEWDDIKW